MEYRLRQSSFLQELAKTGKKPSREEAEAFFEPWRIDKTTLSPASKYIHDTCRVDLEEWEDDALLLAHRKTKWLAPSYFLRKRHLSSAPDRLSDELLLCLNQCQSQQAFAIWQKQYESNIEQAPDELLVLWHKAGHKEALDILTVRHKPFILDLIRHLRQGGRFFRGMDQDDVFQESRIAYLKAVKDFKVERNMKFTVFARYVIEKYLDTLIHQSNNKKNLSLNDAYSFHTPIRNDTEMTFEESFVSERTLPDVLLEKKETFYAIWATMTPLEKDVLVYHTKGYSYEEIGQLIQKDRKAVDNTIQRFRTKAEKYAEESSE